MIRFFVMIVSLVLSFPTSALADSLKIVSWNLANLAEGPNVPLRGQVRTEADYAAIRRLIQRLAPDVIALQEIGSKKGPRLVLGDAYDIVFESRCETNAKQCEADVDDIFTAIAYRKRLARAITPFQIESLAVLHQDCPTEPARQVRGGVGIKLKRGRKTYAIPSLHLKASCKKNSAENDADTQDDCATQAKQIDLLIAWMNAPEQRDNVLIMAGDFNRELVSRTDHVRAKLTKAISGLRFEPTGPRKCWTDGSLTDDAIRAIEAKAREKFPEIGQAGGHPVAYTPKGNQKIDYFVIRGLGRRTKLVAQQVLMGRAQHLDEVDDYLKTCPPEKPLKFPDNGVLVFSPAAPSDHCPIALTITTSRRQ